MTNALTRAGELALAEAERLWNLDVYDPPIGDKRPRAAECLAVIEGVIKASGWGFATPYLGNGPPQWCGLFAGACWRKAGLNPSWLATYWASTYRLGLFATYQKFDQKHPNPPPKDTTDRRLFGQLARDRLLLPFTPRAGDVVIVGDGEPSFGDHITLCVSYDAAKRTFDTISGNGGGAGPKGDKREGISRRTYSIDSIGYRAMFVLRPAFGDLLAEKPAD